MPFSSDTYKKAFEQKRAERYNAQQTYERVWNEIRSANPALVENEQRRQAVSARAAIAALSGDTETVKSLRAECDELNAQRDRLLSGVALPAVSYVCPLCEDTGYVGGKVCSCVDEIAKGIEHERLKREMPIDECRFDNFDLKFYPESSGGADPRKRMVQVFKACREYALGFGKDTAGNLLLLGETGLGKTHLSLAIANEVIDKGYSVVYGSIQNIINGMASENFSYNSTTSYTDSVLGCDLLIIDDLGAEMITSFSKSCVYNIINTRILKNLPTVISTNIKLDELDGVYSPRVTSRIIGNYTPLQFLGNDIRQIKALKRLEK